MGVMVSSNFAKALWPGINSWYGKAYAEHPVEYRELFDLDTSSKAYEEDVGISSFGLAGTKNEGAAVQYDEENQAFLTRYSHAVYALGFIITRELYEDDQYAVVGKRRAKALAFSMRQTKELVAANVYNRAFNSSYTGGDGKEMCATDHPNWAGGTWQNELTTAADLSEASLEQAVIDISKWTNDRGLKIAVQPQKLIVPSDLMFEAQRILESPYRVGTSNNDVNAIGRMGKIPGGYVVNHYLTDTNAWFIKTNAPDGLKGFTRRAMQFGIDNDFDTENAKFKATERYSFGWTDPRGIYGSPGA
jgi:phage major head subunit gpT-like protein